ncbi:Predicted arabinose efflux permease, MFS family [Jatrophihabitans endophyticus]|uniref:Predicted arabinose efflux permease, MFS family n=1 Tax=Jatrophihabitans endophyticus TaxID=1206085 RepID=A0A1M5PFU9_9ACTN|nr:MFS transporter [Jatrophihabitans endophyticus]SHH00610.1 Predicted arabinose efflux permease, MFS family [Jatrophihabitans endophyticus]
MSAHAHHDSAATGSPFRQPKAVWAVAFACVISFMGIGLVDPILPSLREQLGATTDQISLLFTSYLVVTAVAMLVTGWVSSRLGAKRTLIAGLVLIVIFAAAAGASGSIDGIVGFRAGWGLGNALFIATSLAVIVGSASGGFAGAIILYETALGIGIALGPLVGGELGSISWRGPFFGVSVLMAIALVATVFLLPTQPTPARRERITEPIRALRHRSLATTSVVGLLYNWGFFTLLGYSPFLMGDLSPQQLGLVFCGWGILVAAFAVWGAPWLKARFGTARTLYGNFVLMAADLAVIGIWSDRPTVIIVAVIVAGIFIGVNNTLVTTAVMSIAPVERPVASATYGFVRFIGGGLAPFFAAKLVTAFNTHVPFLLGAGTVLLAAIVLATVHRALAAADRGETPQPELDDLDTAERVEADRVGAGIGNTD